MSKQLEVGLEMNRRYIALQPSEQTLVTASAEIYSAYIAAGRVPDGQEAEWLKRAVRAAIHIATMVDEAVQADKEFD